MFESEPSHHYIPYTVNSIFKNKEEITLDIWVEHFSRPYKERNKSINKIFDTDHMLMKQKFVYLEASQIMGRTLSLFGIENVCGEVSKTFLQKFKKRKSRTKRLEKTNKIKNTKPPKNKICNKTFKRSETFEKLLVPRYPPVVERWSDAAFRKFKDVASSKDKSNDQSYTFLTDEIQMNKSEKVNISSWKTGIITDKSTKKLNRPEVYEKQLDTVKNNTNSETNKDTCSHQQKQNNSDLKLNNESLVINGLEYEYENEFKTNQSNTTLQTQKGSVYLIDDGFENGAINFNIKKTQSVPQVSKKTESNEISDHSELWSTTAIINDAEGRNSLVQKEILKKMSLKKSVRFDDNLCSFAPTPQYLESTLKQTVLEYGNSPDKDNCLGNSYVSRNIPETKIVKIASERELFFDDMTKNSNDSNRTHFNISTEKGPDSSKADEVSTSTVSLQIDNSESKKYELTVKDGKKSSLPNGFHNMKTTNNEPDFEIELHLKSDIVVEKTCHSFSTFESPKNTKYGQHFGLFTTQPDQNTLSNDYESVKYHKKKINTQREGREHFKDVDCCIDKKESNQSVGSQNNVSFHFNSKKEIVIEETPSSSEDICDKTSPGVLRSKLDQDWNLNSTNKELYSNDKDLISKESWPQENSDEEYIPLSNCEESFESNCEAEFQKENKHTDLPDVSKPLSNKVLVKLNKSMQSVLQENKFVSQCITMKENKSLKILSSNKNIISHIPQNLSPTASLSDREYLSDDSVLSSQYDVKEVSNTVCDEATAGKINKSLKNEAQNTLKYDTSSVQANNLEATRKQSSEKDILTNKLFIEIDKHDNKHDALQVEKVTDENETTSAVASQITLQVDSSLIKNVSADFSTPQFSKLSQEFISTGETVNFKMSNAPTKKNEMMKNSNTPTEMGIPNKSFFNISNTKLLKTLFPIEEKNGSVDPSHNTINKFKKKERLYECESSIPVLLETASATGNISKVAFSQINTTELNYGIGPNISHTANINKNQNKDPEININNHPSTPRSRLSLTEELTNSQCLADSNQINLNNVGEIRNLNLNVESNTTNCSNTLFINLEKDNCGNLLNSVLVDIMVDKKSNNDLSSEEYMILSPISQDSLKITTENPDNNIRDRAKYQITSVLNKLNQSKKEQIIISDPTQHSQIELIANNNPTLADQKNKTIVDPNKEKKLLNIFEDSPKNCSSQSKTNTKILPQENFDDNYTPLSNYEKSFTSNSEAVKSNKIDIHRGSYVNQHLKKEDNKTTEVQQPSKNVDYLIAKNVSPTEPMLDHEYSSNDCVLSSQYIREETSNRFSNKTITRKKNKSLNIEERTNNTSSVQANKYKTKNTINSKQSSENKKPTDKLLNSMDKYDDKCEALNVEMVSNKLKTMTVFESPTTSQDDYSPINKVSVDFSTPQCSKLPQGNISRREIVNFKMFNAPEKQKEIMQNSNTSTNIGRPNLSFSKVTNTKLFKTLFPIEVQNENLDPPQMKCLYKCKNINKKQDTDSEINLNNNSCKARSRLTFTEELTNSPCLSESNQNNFNNVEEIRNLNLNVESNILTKCSNNTNLQKENCANLINPVSFDKMVDNSFKEDLTAKDYMVVSSTTSLKIRSEKPDNKVRDGGKKNFIDNTTHKVGRKEKRGPQLGLSDEIGAESNIQTICSNTTKLQKENFANLISPLSFDKMVDDSFIEDLSAEDYMVLSPTASESSLKIRTEKPDVQVRDRVINYSIDNTTCKIGLKEKGSPQLSLSYKINLNKLTHFKKKRGEESNEIFDPAQSSQLKVAHKVNENNSKTLSDSKCQLTDIEINSEKVLVNFSEDSEIICATMPIKKPPNNHFSFGNKNSKLHMVNEDKKEQKNSCSMKRIANKYIQPALFSTEEELLTNSNFDENNVFEQGNPKANIFRTSIFDSYISKNSNTSSKQSKSIDVCVSSNNAINVHKDKSSLLEKPNFKRYYSTQNKVHTYHKEKETKLNEVDNRLTKAFELESSGSDKIFNKIINQEQTLNSYEKVQVSETDTSGTAVVDQGNKNMMNSPRWCNDVKASGSKNSQFVYFKENNCLEAENLQTVWQNYTFSGQCKKPSSDNADSSIKILFGTSSPCKLELKKRLKTSEKIGTHIENNTVKINCDKNYLTNEAISPQRIFYPNYDNTRLTYENVKTYIQPNSPIKLKRVITQQFNGGKDGDSISKYASSLKIPLTKQFRYASTNHVNIEIPEPKRKTEKYCDEEKTSLAFRVMCSKPPNRERNPYKTSSSDVNELQLNQNESFRLNNSDIKISNKQLLEMYSEEDFPVSSLMSESEDLEDDKTLRDVEYFSNLNKSTTEKRKRKYNPFQEIFPSNQESKYKRGKSNLNFSQDIDELDAIPSESPSESNNIYHLENSFVYNSDSYSDIKSDLSDEPEFEHDILNSGPQHASSDSQSSNNMINNFQQGSDLSSVGTSSEFPSMGSGFIPTSPNDCNKSDDEYLAAMFDEGESS